jgi:transposase
MKIVGRDFHPSFQQIAVLDITTGEIEQRRLGHSDGEAEQFYGGLEAPALIGMEAVGNSLWFEQLVARLGHQLWIGDAAQIRASYVRRQKTDRRDAGHILRLLVEQRFPRIWVPSSEQRDVRQLLLHRHKLVGMRTRVKTELQHLALNQGMQKKRHLWSVRGGLILKTSLWRPGPLSGAKISCRCCRCWRARWRSWIWLLNRERLPIIRHVC